MSKSMISIRHKHTAIAIAIAGALSSTAALADTTMHSNAKKSKQKSIEVIQVTGMLSSLKASMLDKKQSVIVSDGIKAEDLGKFPDLNVAESLQRITGVSIDRNGGEGQSATVRGFGPQFNTVLVNGRQLATDSAGRAFNFDVLSADQITGADVYKSTRADFQEGGIGGTINLSTAKPFDHQGFHLVGSVKGMYESLSGKTSPDESMLISNTFNNDKMGVLLSVSHSQRKVQINQILTAGWRPGQTISNSRDGVLFTNAYIPRNWDQVVDQQNRTRTNANLVMQYAPSDDLIITLDGFVSKFKVDSVVADLASWFEPDRVGSATIDPTTGTLLTFSQDIGLSQGSGNPASDFVSHTRNSRDVSNHGYGLNAVWDINDKLVGKFDISTSSAMNDQAGKNRFNVIGIINNYKFDGTGGIPTVIHDGFTNGSLPAASRARMHYNEKNGFTDKDKIIEYKADFVYTPDQDVFQQAKFGIYRQEREKSRYQISGSQCFYCGYGTPAPLQAVDFRPFTAKNFFPGLIDKFYTYNGDAYVNYLATSGHPIVPTLQNNRYKINENITSLYMEFTLGYDLGDMPLTANFGARYSSTSVTVGAVQSYISDIVPTTDATLFANVFGPATDISKSNRYANLLPSVNLKLEIEKDMILHFSVYDSLTRPTMSQLSPATTFNEPRRQNLTASGGNPDLKPFRSKNWDASFEWYYGDSNLFSFAVFSKDVENFIVRLTGNETYTLADRANQPGFVCNVNNSALCAGSVAATTTELHGSQEVYTVTRPQNGKTARVNGYEVALTHVFQNGFGITANATVVSSNASINADTTKSFALEGLGNSQNLVLFYEQPKWQTRIAFNNREPFLRLLDNGFNGEPVNTRTYGQWDVSGSYNINKHFSLFFEGVNITKSQLKQTGRFANQIYSIEDNGSRYSIGIRGKF